MGFCRKTVPQQGVFFQVIAFKNADDVFSASCFQERNEPLGLKCNTPIGKAMLIPGWFEDGAFRWMLEPRMSHRKRHLRSQG